MLARTPKPHDFDRAGWERFLEGFHKQLATAAKVAPRKMTDDEFDYEHERREGWANTENER